MISYWDREYQLTKRIKQRRGRIRPPLDSLAEWISEKFDVTTLNVIFNRRRALRPPRLQVILERERHWRKFQRNGNFDRRKQAAIAKKLGRIIEELGKREWDLEGLFVVFSAFAPLARAEADSLILAADIEALKRRIANPDLWEISRCCGRVTFFFYTDEQVRRYRSLRVAQEYASQYFELLEACDEFGYCRRSGFKVELDSKQNLDENYEGSWFYYYR